MVFVALRRHFEMTFCCSTKKTTEPVMYPGIRVNHCFCLVFLIDVERNDKFYIRKDRLYPGTVPHTRRYVTINFRRAPTIDHSRMEKFYIC